MYKIGDLIVYKRDVCKIKEIKNNYFNNNDYYTIYPVNDESLTINIPINNNSYIRSLISKKDIEDLIKLIPNINVIESNEKMMEYEYKNLINSGRHEDLIKVIKTTYLRNKERSDNNKKIGAKDSSYLILAEKYLYTEIACVLNISFEDAKNYIINKVTEIDH